jgi:S-adenosylmethionine:tRNA ribosyltransferase-isomerase
VISKDAAKKLNDAKKHGKRIIAVGTTSLRTLESNIKDHTFHEGTFQTSIFIYPGYTFKAIDGLITNFHLPKSTLLMLVSAITERNYMLSCYQHAIDHNYRFFSFGDAMLIL